MTDGNIGAKQTTAIPGIRKSGPEKHALLKRQNEEKTEREDEDYQSDAKLCCFFLSYVDLLCYIWEEQILEKNPHKPEILSLQCSDNIFANF